MTRDEAWFQSLLRPELSSLRAYVPAAAPADVVRLDANESPWPLDDGDRRALADALAAVPMHRYPDVRATALRELVAARANAHPDEVVIGCGSDEVIALILNAMANPRPGRAQAVSMFPDPTFVMFRASSLSLGVRPVAVPLDAQWDLDLDAFRDAVSADRPNVVFLPSPNNPTGNVFSRDRVEALVTRLPDALVLLDEAYGPFSEARYDDLRAKHPHVGQLQTLSKLGLAGARVGWAILPRALAAEVEKVRQPYNLNALSQRAAVACLTDLAPSFAAAVARIKAERARVATSLAAIEGVSVTPSDANFVWAELPRDAGDVHAGMLARGVVVRSFHAHGPRTRRHLRITVGTPAENDRMLDALRAALSDGATPAP